MTGQTPEITEADASGEVAALSADIKAAMGVGMVTRSTATWRGGVRLKRAGHRNPAIRRTSGRGKFAPLGEGGGSIGHDCFRSAIALHRTL